MKRTLLIMGLTACAAFAQTQAPTVQQNGQTGEKQPSQTLQGLPGQTPTGSPTAQPGHVAGAAGNTTSGGTRTGVLMDASCSAIASRQTGSSTLKTYSAGGGTGTTSGPNSASAIGTTGAAIEAPRATPSAVDQNGQQRSISQQGTAGTVAGMNHTGTTAAPGATSGASSASAQGTTGAATTGATGAPAAGFGQGNGERSRSADAAMDNTVRERYRDCMARSTTTAFAIHSNGQLYVLDQASNDLVRQQMSGEAFRASMSDRSGDPKWLTVTVNGTASGDRLTVTSVRR